MGAIIGLGAWGGPELDAWSGNQKPVYTIIFSLLAIAISLYLFLVPLSVLTIWFVLWRFKKDNTSAGSAYFITVFFKMFGSAFFLYPGVVTDASLMKPTAVQFMIIFFLLLFIETILLVKLLNAPLDEKSKNDENQKAKS